MATKKSIQEFQRKMAALASHLRNGGSKNAETLSRSYGLPLPDVERVIRSMKDG